MVQHGYICRSQKCVEKPDPCVPNPCGPGALCIIQVGIQKYSKVPVGTRTNELPSEFKKSPGILLTKSAWNRGVSMRKEYKKAHIWY
jgi:hypothetical protein